MCAVDELFIPLQTEFFALQGLGRLTGTVDLVRSRLNPSLAITGIIPCMFDVRTSLALEVLRDIKSHFGPMVFNTIVRKNVRLAEAPSFGVPITCYDDRCYGTDDYRSLAREVHAMPGRAMAEAVVEQEDAEPTPPAPEAERPCLLEEMMPELEVLLSPAAVPGRQALPPAPPAAAPADLPPWAAGSRDEDDGEEEEGLRRPA